MAQPGTSRIAERADNRFFGKYRGIVKDNQDPEKLGRLKLQVPSVLGESPDCYTDWAWPCVPFGGAGEQGFFFIPEKDAHVWVEFEEGNLDLPLWVGTVWAKPGGKTQVPTEAQDMSGDNPQRRVLKTPSGHSLEFCDVAGKEAITIRHKDGARVVLDEKGNVIVANKAGTFIYLNAADKQATWVDENGNHIDLKDGGITITNSDGSFVDLAGDSVQLSAKNVHIRSQTVSLGEGAMEPAILGMSFGAMYDAHMHPHPLGPTGPPIPVPMPLSAPTNPAVSKVVKVK